jgi:type VI secretion system secreted protein Hcp
MLGCMNGKHFKGAQLVMRKAGGDAPLEYMKLKLEDLLVTSVSTGGSGGEDRLTENISINFAKVHFTYTPQMGDGSGDAMKKAGWNIPANEVHVVT